MKRRKKKKKKKKMSDCEKCAQNWAEANKWRERALKAEQERDALRAELRKTKAELASRILGWDADDLRAELAVKSLRLEQLEAEGISAKYCASCGLLLPNHADGCGRWERVIAALRAENEALKAKYVAEMTRANTMEDAANNLKKERDELRLVMEAAASMAGKDWLWCQLAIAEKLSGSGGEHLEWMMKEYEKLKRREGE